MPSLLVIDDDALVLQVFDRVFQESRLVPGGARLDLGGPPETGGPGVRPGPSNLCGAP